ncbi:ACP S-malonyltransferase [Sphingosinicella rhizophila]|uniref:[acyl-carrier-protein] S-malonyltransferase n=1 Tax=Sphingosinicella rhizophila TaxID=3050082 RepID=A0ABU3QAA5_9SPHN|nr:ACP S-malonyltransferase [Sphingosinicella sp. GR2756]MDT9600345.1 ACP S-malonyltransferase [Sphingosinicella sp. GR2756]
MAEGKLSALVVCPGRGTYNKAELGYLRRHHADKRELLRTADRIRAERGEPTVSDLDGADRYSVGTYSRGDVASPLIFTAAYADFLDIDRSRFDIAAVTGNSMGWYIALACAGAVDMERGFAIVDAMGDNSQAGAPGGQVLVSLVDEDWREVPGLRASLGALAEEIGGRPDHALFLSIDLAGMLVFAGNEAGLAALLAERPDMPGREPLRLANHGPFHSRLMQESSNRALARFTPEWFDTPEIPMVDGRGHIWRPFASKAEDLAAYTFATQILETYDFARAIQVAVREHAPDRIILLGPGDTLGGAIAQALIGIQWLGLRSKSDFQDLQVSRPFLLSMGREEQRASVVL